MVEQYVCDPLPLSSHNTYGHAGIGVFQEYYQNVLLKEYSPSTIAWIPSLQIFFLMASVS
jgi:hypothetical protein